MKYALGNMLNGGIQGIDPNAKSYINAIVSAGATVTSDQRNAINTFYKSAKTRGYYSQLKRFYLPIWGIAAPNAVDLITTASGTFVGGVTHAAGYIQGNGTTGRFDISVSPDTLGLVDGSASLSSLIYASQIGTGFRVIHGVTQTSPAKKNLRITRNLTTTVLEFGVAASQSGDINFNGIYIGSETASNSRYSRVRRSGGVTSLATNTSSSTGGYPTINPQVMAANNSSAFANFSADQIGSTHIGLAMTTAQADEFTLALKTLWETCTGLALP
jgi:hypothetical protein